MAAWNDDMTWGADDAHDVLESHGRDVRVSDDYDWDGELEREVASPTFRALVDPVDRVIAVFEDAA